MTTFTSLEIREELKARGIHEDFGVNQGLVEELYLRYRENPSLVDEEWRRFFEGLPPSAVKSKNGNGGTTTAAVIDMAHAHQARVTALVEAYRSRGHLSANIDPLGLMPRSDDELNLSKYGLDAADTRTTYSTDIPGASNAALPEIVERLQQTYCGSIGVEYTFVQNAEARAWLQQRMESTRNQRALHRDEALRALRKLTDAEFFEQFVHTNYVGAKRFSLEGGESMIPALDFLYEAAAKLGVEEIVLGMAHRGRLNVLVNSLEKQLQEIFFAFEDKHPELNLGRGDVKYHLGYSSDRVLANKKKIHLSLCFNPSHLEFVNPVVEGRVRAKQDRMRDTARTKVLPLLLHGDAAFMGQGIVPETLNFGGLEGYHTGGTIHVVTNNQVGFTTPTRDARSTRYATDITRMLGCPVFHVNSEDMGALVHVMELAAEYRQRYHQDVVVDLICYRRYGHNEADEPRFTQPTMYALIDGRKTYREAYVEQLVQSGQVSESEVQAITDASRKRLQQALEVVRSRQDYVPPVYSLQGVWKPYRGGKDTDAAEVSTAVPVKTLQDLLRKMTEVPKGFQINPKVQRLLEERRARADGDKPFDWGTAESLAYATLVSEGAPVRISGQDCRRGTFSHRHATLFDGKTGALHTPLQHVSPKQARFDVFNSPLSEAAVLGFDYGYSLDTPEALVVWEAQFGDFVNGAQVILDQFITSSEDKWHRLSGITLLLPHGFEGQGPEHSSARLERFLSACAEDNIQVCNLTTPAQIFHCLRRQVRRPFRKPLVIMSPKSLLRHPRAVSSLQELAEGSFQRVIADTQVKPSAAKKVLFCTGKVYYDLLQAREDQKRTDVAIVRLEQLYPFRDDEIRDAFAGYKKGTPVVWVQEEPRNMGAWPFIQTTLAEVISDKFDIRCVSRPRQASPATGSNASHKLEQANVIQDAFSA
jgi:2-oxoglutarate dehydrogenase E1 component